AMTDDELGAGATQQIVAQPQPQPRSHSPGSESHGGFVVLVEEGGSTGNSVRLDGTEGALIVGSSSVCHLRINDPLVSRRHLSFEVTSGMLRSVDLGSTNGRS